MITRVWLHSKQYYSWWQDVYSARSRRW